MLGDKIKKLRKNMHITQEDLAKKININRSTIGMIESNKQGTNNDVIKEIAQYFNVSFDFLISDFPTDTCPICGYNYYPLEKDDFEEHKLIHNNLLQFPDKEFYLTYKDREALKKKVYRILENNNSSIKEKASAVCKLYQCWFSRSLESYNFDIKHPLFKDYIAMMLNRSDSKANLSEPVYNMLVAKYGVKEGIANGETYVPTNKINSIDSKDEKILLNNYNKLNDLGKRETNKRVSELTEIPKYTRDTFKEPITIAAHDDNLTDNEKDEMNRRIEEFEKNLNK